MNHVDCSSHLILSDVSFFTHISFCCHSVYFLSSSSFGGGGVADAVLNGGMVEFCACFLSSRKLEQRVSIDLLDAPPYVDVKSQPLSDGWVRDIHRVVFRLI